MPGTARLHRVEAVLLRRTLRTLNTLLPRDRRYHPRPLAGWRREAAERATTPAGLLRCPR